MAVFLFDIVVIWEDGMNALENILIIAGISLDIFAAMEIEGAMLAVVKRKSLIIACTLVAVLQMIFYFGGYFICFQIAEHELLAKAGQWGYIVSIIVFVALGVQLWVKGVKKEFVHEKRCENLDPRKYIRIITVTSFYTLAAGCACGLVGTSVWMMLAVIVICSILVVIGGLYAGYHFGFETKTFAYYGGAILLWIAGTEILLRAVLHVI